MYVLYYRSALYVGRVLYGVATLWNIAKDLFRNIMVRRLIEYLRVISASVHATSCFSTVCNTDCLSQSVAIVRTAAKA